MRKEQAPIGGMLEGVPTTHAKQRLKHAYQLAQLISEFRVLRATILRLLLQAEDEQRSRGDGREGIELRVAELARLNAGLDQAISDSVEYFVEERERVRERFIAVLGHDLRTPLGAIVMSADHLLRSGRLPAGLDRAAARIARNSARMSRMVTDLLDLARGRLGDGMPIDPARVDMEEVCHAAVEDAILASPEREITVSASGDLWGSWDRDRALQAVGNLLANAIRYGHGPVAVTAARVAGDVVVQVTNQGEPIAPDGLPKLFDPFQRGESGAVGREGLGLGLYIVSEIMRAHGGGVSVVSSRERGTTFTLTWPRSDLTPAR
jgi:signal transduction histidine kinase